MSARSAAPSTTATTAAPPARPSARRRRRRLRSATRSAIAFAGLLSACAEPAFRIPPIDGPLALEVRYPTDGIVLGRDSVAVWGTAGTGRATVRIGGRTVKVEPNGAFAAFEPVPEGDTAVLRVAATLGSDSAVLAFRILRRAPGPDAREEGAVRPWGHRVRLRRLPDDTLDRATQDRPIFARWRPDGAVAFGLPQGIRLHADARTDGHVRLRLAPDLRVWIPAADAESLGPAPPRTAAFTDLRVDSASGIVSVSVTADEPVHSSVEYGAGRLVWTLWGGELHGDVASKTAGILRSVARLDGPPGTARLELPLRAQPLGWKTEWSDGRIHLRIRPVPRLGDRLAGLVVGLDAGHPPGGTTGAAGLTEDSMTLAVATAAAARLRDLGASPILIRDGPGPVSLDERIVRAERANVHIFVSIHGNSPGPGRPPDAVLGTMVLWLNHNAYPLARRLFADVARTLRQRRIAIVREDLAVLRPAWFPAVIVEGTAMTVPEREAFLRSPAGIDAYADGIVAAVRAWAATAGVPEDPPADSATGRPPAETARRRAP